MKEVDPATAAASQGYPDKAVLNVTLDQLKAAPDFKYASSAVADSDMRPAARSDNEEDDSVIDFIEGRLGSTLRSIYQIAERRVTQRETTE